MDIIFGFLESTKVFEIALIWNRRNTAVSDTASTAVFSAVCPYCYQVTVCMLYV